MAVLLHDTADFGDLIEVLAGQTGIDPGLVEKDYWIMHVLRGLQEGGDQVSPNRPITISTRFRQQQASGEMPTHCVRHSYNVDSLPGDDGVQSFIGSDACAAHKASRFRGGRTILTIAATKRSG